MKIGIITEYFYPTIGGITENVYNLSLHLLKRGRDFRIITGKQRRPTPDWIDPEIRRRMIFLGTSVPVAFNDSIGRVTMGFGLTRKMREILRSEKFDIIHGHSPIFPTLPPIANMQQDAPYVGTFHTCMDTHKLLNTFKWLVVSALDRMAGRIAVSHACARENEDLFSYPFDVIPNGVDVDWWHTDEPRFERYDDGKINILFVGRPDIRNGLDHLIRAFPVVHKKHPNTRFIIVGSGPLLPFFKSMVPHAVSKHVHFEGAADLTRPRYLKTADIFCFLPSIASFGITILEGMAAGKAIVASDIEAFRALISDGETGTLVDPHDETKIAAAICRLVEDEDLRHRMGAAARHAVWRYSWEHVTEMHLEYYERVLEKTT